MPEHERFVVTGAGAAIGAWVVHELLAEGVEVIAIDDSGDDHRLRLVAGADRLARLTRRPVDMLNARDLRMAMAGATHVVHVDTVTADDCDDNPAVAAMDVVGAATNVFNAADELAVRGLSFASSMTVFSPAPSPVAPHTIPDPSSALGRLRRATEMIAAALKDQLTTGIVGLRTNLVYGPGQDRGRIAEPTMAMAAIVNNESVHVAHDGSADFQFVGDVARALIAAARSATHRPGVYNLCGSPMSISEFVSRVAASNGEPEFTIGESVSSLPVAATDPRLEDLLGSWSPRSVQDGVRESLEVFRWAPRDLYLVEAI